MGKHLNKLYLGFISDDFNILKEQKNIRFETKCRLNSGLTLDVEVSISKSKDMEHTFCFIRDITERKYKESELIYVSYHDVLTGLYNRAFFEEEIKRLDNNRQLPISFIIADINGLKFANDTFGHEQGDRLLISFASVLKACLRTGEIIARWGGDEFVVLLPKTTNDIALNICERINSLSKNTVVGPLNLSVAIGTSTKTTSEQLFKDVISDAENLMYQDKHLHSKKDFNELVSSLMEKMYEYNYETKEHVAYMLKIVTKIGHKLDLMPQEIEELRLLAVLHDIGKLGLPVEIFKKPDKLTSVERAKVKTHSDIGYRLAESSPKLKHISKYILSVHERWDGKGYPQGLKESSIPKLSRIISIVTSYDAMINGRPHKKPMTQAQAKRELLRCSGTQFDPFLVKLFVTLDIT